METGAILLGQNVERSAADALPHVRTSVQGFAHPRHSSFAPHDGAQDVAVAQSQIGSLKLVNVPACCMA